MHGRGKLHRLPAHTKIVGLFLFVLAVVLTPREAVWAFALHLVAIVVVASLGEIPGRTVLRRLAIEVPFVAFALVLPFVASGERIDFLSLSLSREGLWAAWNVVAKATLGIAAGALLVSSTQPADLVRGLGRLRFPRLIVAIAGFMVRYADVVTGEMRRMRIARESRAADPRWIWQARALASSAGTLFIRSYERGERVYLAMLSRGYAGALPAPETGRTTRDEWALSLAPALIAAFVVAVASVSL